MAPSPASAVSLLPRSSRLGAICREEGGVDFTVWAPFHKKITIVFPEKEENLALSPSADGFFSGFSIDAKPGDRYLVLTEKGESFPDPASRFQPDGVHQPSQIVPSVFPWEDQSWAGLPLEKHIFYELHPGTFTPEGTFYSAAEKISYLRELGVTAIELMPVAAFPGSRNWGYDGACPFAVQESYGGPEALKFFVNAAHQAGLAVILDVVYNHLGPEGNYLGQFGPYFTDSYHTGWGPSINFDGWNSDGVRRYFSENALMWLEEFHLDGLRLDAVHAIRDFSAVPFLVELGVTVKSLSRRLSRPLYLFPESDLNDTRIIRPLEQGGYGLDSQWSDDFHHALHVVLTGEKNGYYGDFNGLDDLARAMNDGFVYTGQHSEYRNRRHGNRSRDVPPSRFISFLQNHDQVGNRARGDRLSTILSPEQLALGAAVNLLSPFLPLLFMGEEYGEMRPFPYFISHSDPGLVKAVREGRARDFRSFKWPGRPMDPQSSETFEAAKLDWATAEKEPHQSLLKLYKDLIRFRQKQPVFSTLDRKAFSAEAYPEAGVLALKAEHPGRVFIVFFNFSDTPWDGGAHLKGSGWRVSLNPSEEGKLALVDDVDEVWSAAVAPCSFFIVEKGEKSI